MRIQHFQKVCLNGHQVTDYYSAKTNPNPPEYCELCGKPIIVTCPNCANPIAGGIEITDWIGSHAKVSVPNYCKFCGLPYPWTETILSSALELIALDDDLSNDDRLLIKSAIPDLLVDTPKTQVAEAKFRKVFGKASKIVKDGLYNLLVDVLSETAKKAIFEP